ncbi:hypothetical protein [Photorhabdus asymbiotica]|uniref:hypothetical protein n=1 Tax=Photorhabdus asymbiotica TaxID=291112 RepID=UPI003DA75CCA
MLSGYLRANHSVVAWGNPSSGSSIPLEIARLQDIVSLSASKNAFAALRRNGQIVAWNTNNDNIVHSEYDD